MKNIPYNIFVKCIALVIIVISCILLLDFQYISSHSGEAFYDEAFFETDSFQETYVRLSHNVVEKYLDLISDTNIDDTRSGVDVVISKDRLEAINDNLRKAPSFLYVFINNDTGETISNIGTEPSQSESKPEGEASNNLDETIVKDELSIKPAEYIKSLNTVVQWDSSGVFFPTNSVMVDQPFSYRHYISSSQFSATNVSAADVIYRLRSGDWTYYTAVDFSLVNEDLLFGNDYLSFNNSKARIDNYIPFVTSSFVFLFLMTIYLATVIGRKKSDTDAVLFFYDYIPIEIQTLIVFVASTPLMQWINFGNAMTDEREYRFQLAIRSSILIVALLAEGLSIVRLVKTKYIYKNPLLFIFGWWIRKLFILNYMGPLVKVKVLVIGSCYVIYTVATGIFLSLGFSFQLKLIALSIYIVIHALLVMYMLTMVRDISSLITATKKRVEGDIAYPINENEYKFGFKNFAKDLNELQNGLQLALEEAIKGEKLKTELITNVSHDLKNPLTSIVTYIDLLDKSLIRMNEHEIDEQERVELQECMEDYIEIINKKSYRLNTLIEDLVAASKASSGNLAVDLMNIDIHQLMLQCLGEKEQGFVQGKLEIILEPLHSEPIWAHVDPNHMYRVFDNLLSNCIKYSLEATRIFITMEVLENVVITIKNISNHPLDYKDKDLSKRFVRGDDSRSTEGSGLGLSIVESLLALQDGKQQIIVDGDMFKVIVSVPVGVIEVISEETNVDI